VAEKVSKTKTCDVPTCSRRGAKVKHWRLDNTDGFLEADLCEEHAGPIHQVIDSLPDHMYVKLPPGTSRTSRVTGFHKVTMDEIESEKKKRR
jgi:hypothetical protein